MNADELKAKQWALLCKAYSEAMPLDQAERQLLANRKAARLLPNGRRSFAHQLPYRPHFIAHILCLRSYTRALRAINQELP